MKTNSNKCKRCLKTTIWICFFECLFIALFKVAIGLTSGSKAMLASCLYSLTDLVSAFLMIISLRIAERPADRGHPYGHAKIEYLAAFLISLVVLIGAVALLVVSTYSLYSVGMQRLHWIGIWASVACLALNEIVYRLVVCAGTRAHSPAMKAHAKHVLADSFSDYAVIVGIGAAELGFQHVDPAIAVIEGVHILFVCAAMMHKAVGHLMDASIGQTRLEAIYAILSKNPEIMEIRDVKGKQSGRGVSLDIEIALEGSRKIAECNTTVRDVEKAIRDDVTGVDTVHVHYHPCSVDEAAGLSL